MFKERCVEEMYFTHWKHKLNTVLAPTFLNRLNYVDIAASYRLIIIKVYVYFNQLHDNV
jgi:hypothetical protein